MSDSINLANVFFTLVPSLDGVQSKIRDAVVPPAEQAGDEAGDKAGSGFGGAFNKRMAGLAAGAALAGAFKGLYEIGSTFDEVSDTIRAGTGASGAALEGLVDVARSVGRDVPAEFSAIGPVVSDLNTRLGLSGETLETVASQYLEAGRVLGEEVDIEATSAAFSAFKVEGDAVAGAMDSLFQISQSTGVGINELASLTQSAAPSVKQLGWGFEETAAFVGVFDKAGLDASKMLGPMSRGLVEMAKAGEEPAEVFPRVVGELESLIASGDTAGAIDLASGIFGTRGAIQFVDAVGSGTLALDDLVGAANLSGDTILGVGADTADFAEKWQMVKNNAALALEPLASTVFDSLGAAFAVLVPHMQSLSDWLGANQEVLFVFATFMGVTLTAAFTVWTTSIWASTVALLANPVTWVVLGIVALTAAIALLAVRWDEITAFVTEKWGTFLAWATEKGDAFGAWWNGLWSGVSSWISSQWENITSGISSAIDSMMSWFRSIPGGITDAFRSVTETVKAPFRDAFNGIASLWNGTVGQLSWTVPDWVPYIGGNTVSVPNLPMLATGGTAIAPGWAIVGETGPELLRMHTGASVIPLPPPSASTYGGAFPSQVVLKADDGTYLGVFRTVADERVNSALAPVGRGALADRLGR